jgi:hypothetical protein
MYKNTELLYKYARAFSQIFSVRFTRRPAAIFVAGAIFPVFPLRGRNERPL